MNKCPKCKRPLDPFHHYFIYNNTENKVIEICKECLDKRKVHRMFVKVKGKTRVID